MRVVKEKLRCSKAACAPPLIQNTNCVWVAGLIAPAFPSGSNPILHKKGVEGEEGREGRARRKEEGNDRRGGRREK